MASVVRAVSMPLPLAGPLVPSALSVFRDAMSWRLSAWLSPVDALAVAVVSPAMACVPIKMPPD